MEHGDISTGQIEIMLADPSISSKTFDELATRLEKIRELNK